MNEFFTWEFLTTYAGASLATGIVTQFLKGIFSKLPTQALAYMIALGLLLAAAFFTGRTGMASAALALLNAVLVAAAASGTYDIVRRIKEERQ